MKRYIFILLVLVFVLNACTDTSRKVIWVSSAPDAFWQVKEISANTSSNFIDSAIVIYPEKFRQKIDGFGGCFNELGWKALNLVSLEERDKIISSIFDTVDGCKFSICRMPMGANDYSSDWYSYDEVNNDFKMEHFSIEREMQTLVPYIKEAQKYNPALKMWASPWCPPSWMKTNNHYACHPDTVNDLNPNGEGREMVNQFRMEKDYLEAYALYFAKFIEAYKTEGIDIYSVHVQNEPNSCQNFPSCIWTPSALATFIGEYLGPKFEEENLSTEIWLGTIERPQIERIDTILTNEKAKKYIKGVGFQWAGKDAIAQVEQKYPDVKLMQTETECGFGSNDWKAAEYTFNLMQHYFNSGAGAYMYWNMVLDETGKSNWGWKQNSMITVDSKTKEVSYNPEFYLMKHFSSFIEPGSLRIETSDKSCLSFINNNILIIIYHNNGDAVQKQFVINDKSFSVPLAAHSFNTFEIHL